MALQELDSSNGALLPFYDPDTNVVYVCGKVGQGQGRLGRGRMGHLPTSDPTHDPCLVLHPCRTTDPYPDPLIPAPSADL